MKKSIEQEEELLGALAESLPAAVVKNKMTAVHMLNSIIELAMALRDEIDNDAEE